MAQLRYKPDNINPQGKPRVFFACQEQDFKGFFQTVSDEILKSSNCVIYYYDEAPEQDEDYFLNLSRMNLVVMPVTSRLLYLPNRAMDVEFSYAVSHHIPVLPLMQESGLEEKYKEKFGDLQFLNKYDPDPTALPYTDKLKKYLEAVLVGDELAAKVRAAFDAYIFLSYRKKDRKLAQELMKLIHKNPLCRDIAIWYDEFLTPGESFNDAIRAALEKSNLFVLAVTPNLINGVNYVMTVEYPMAMEAGKPILPAEMEPTDPAGLSASYEGIPESVNPRDEEAMLARLRALAIEKNDTDPMHNFFIGLAYLSGIDVEVDHEYALTLITAAAESGLTEAMEKLVSMYETGEGVKRDYLTAISWQERLVEQAEQLWEETGSGIDADDYIIQLERLGNCWLAVLNLPAAKAVFEKMLWVSEDLGKSSCCLETFRYVSACYMRLGDIEEMNGNQSNALLWYRKSVGVSEQLVEMGLMAAVRDLADGYGKLGGIALAFGDLADAKGLLRKCLELREILAESGSVQSIWKLCISHMQLGDAAMAGDELEDAQQWFLRAHHVARQLYELSGRMRELAMICRRMGDAAVAGKEYKIAEKWYLEALEIAQRDGENGSLSAVRELALAYNNMGSIARLRGNHRSAKKWYMEGLETTKRLVGYGVKLYWEDLASCYDWLGDLACAEGDYALATDWYQKKVEVNERLAESQKPEDLANLSDSYVKIGEVEEEARNWVVAGIWYLKALRLRQRLANEKTPKSLKDVSACYRKLGDIANIQGDTEAAKFWYRDDLNINRKLIACEKTPDSFESLAFSLFVVGFLENDLHLLWEARSICIRLLEFRPENDQYLRHFRLIENAIYRLLHDTNS